MSPGPSKKKSKLKRIGAVIVAVFVVGLGYSIISQMQLIRQQRLMKSMFIVIEPNNQTPTEILLDTRKPREMLKEELAIALKPLFPVIPDEDAGGTVTCHYTVIIKTKPKILTRLNPFSKNNNSSFISLPRDYGIQYYIQYKTEPEKRHRFAFKVGHLWVDKYSDDTYSSFQIAVIDSLIDYCDIALKQVLADVDSWSALSEDNVTFERELKTRRPMSEYYRENVLWDNPLIYPLD